MELNAQLAENINVSLHSLILVVVEAVTIWQEDFGYILGNRSVLVGDISVPLKAREKLSQDVIGVDLVCAGSPSSTTKDIFLR